ncbi:hypothetical protein EZV62_017979 [Acer yangbiense]|uniref:Uncharacterized protein n=1 Tax=Acer yangbiense TaxID=1000413 RepID=A0A5C7HK99_9ROSI|nr:hypothetical protein EZV62_017979 [Acer yangbiense]
MKYVQFSKQSPKVKGSFSSNPKDEAAQTCKRKVVFESAEDNKILKKVRIPSPTPDGRKATSLKELFRFGDGFSVDSVGSKGGLMFIWRFSGFYGNPNPSLRVNSLDLLRCLRAVNNFPWVCVCVCVCVCVWVGEGDFNELLCMNEKVGGSEKSFSGMILFRQASNDCDLSDLGCSGPFLT